MSCGSLLVVDFFRLQIISYYHLHIVIEFFFVVVHIKEKGITK